MTVSHLDYGHIKSANYNFFFYKLEQRKRRIILNLSESLELARSMMSRETPSHTKT